MRERITDYLMTAFGILLLLFLATGFAVEVWIAVQNEGRGGPRPPSPHPGTVECRCVCPDREVP
jgi:hypothetical protein